MYLVVIFTPYRVGKVLHFSLESAQHQNGEGANHTRKHLPVKLVYCESYERVADAFAREKQVQGWIRKKKEALIAADTNQLHRLAACLNGTSHVGFGSAQPTAPTRSLSEAEGSITRFDNHDDGMLK